MSLLVSTNVAAIFSQRDAVPGVFAFIEICHEKFPEYRVQNATAFAEWVGRNKSAVMKAQKQEDPDFATHVRLMKDVLTKGEVKIDDETWRKHCSGLASELRKRESDLPAYE
jgi:membrane protein implicated in regulation of membrane protease activity